MSKQNKFFATAATAALVASAIVPVASAAEFTDADKVASWATEAVEALSTQGVIAGNPDGSFNPTGNVTRAEAAKMFTVALDLSTEGTENFTDVNGEWFAEYVVAAVNANIVNGMSATTFAPKANLTREQAAKMIVEAYGLTGEAKLSTFADAKTVEGKWSESYLSTAVATGVINGKGDKLAATDSISRQEFAVMLTRAMDAATVDYAAELTEAVAALETAVKALEAEVTIEKIAVAKAAVEAAKTAVKEVEVALEAAKEVVSEEEAAKVTAAITAANEAITATEAKIAKVEEAAKAFQVVSVSAVNSKEITVTFNKEVNEASAVNAANYTFVKNGVILTASDLVFTTAGKEGTLSEDGKSVTFKLATALTNADKYAVHVSNAVLAKDLKQIEKYTDEAKTFTDAVAPTVTKSAVVSGVAANTKRVRLTFSEPINPSATNFNVKIDGTMFAVDTTSNYPSTGVYTVETNDIASTNAIFNTGDHTVVVYNATDLIAPNANVTSSQSSTYSVAADVTAPTVKEVQPINSRSFRVVFSEQLSVAPTLTVQKGNYTFVNGTGNGQVEVVADTVSDIRNAYIVSIKDDAVNAVNPLWATTDASVALSVKVEGYKDTANLLGNPVTQTVTLSKDTKTPVVEVAALNSISATDLVLKFNGKLDSTVDASKIVVRNKDGVIVHSTNVTAVVDGTDATLLKIAKASFSPAYATSQEPYTVELKAGAVKYAVDSAAVSYSVNTNKNAAFTTAVSTTSSSSPVVVKTDAIISAATVAIDGKIAINYGEDMDVSAKELANYTIDGAALPTGTTIDFVGGTQTVLITLPEGSYNKTQSASFSISTNVKTKAGSSVVVNAQTKKSVEKLLTFTDNAQPELSKAEYLVTTTNQSETNRIKLTFSEDLAAVANTSNVIDDLKVVVNGNTQTISSIDDVTANDNYVIVTLATPVNVGQAATISVVPVSTLNAAINITDIATNLLATDKTVTTLAQVALDTDLIGQNAVNAAAAALAAAQTAVTNAQATADAATTAVTNAQATADAAATAVTNAQTALAADATNQTLIDALATAQTAKTSADADLATAQTAKTNADAALATAQAALAAL